MPSSTILGHRFLLETLEEDLAKGNVTHAYLFSGPRHLGKFTIAKWFAKELLMHGVEEDARAGASNQIDRLLHPDLLVLDQLWVADSSEDFEEIALSSNISQQHRKKAGARTDTISIEDVRVLQERLHEVRTGQYRCCLIRSMERMQNEAVNALLKVLEEPPPGVVFILTTQTQEQLLPTLTSRTRVLRFSRLATADLRPLLAGFSAQDAQFILQFSQGAPGTVCRLRDDPEFLREERLVFAKAASFWQTQSRLEQMNLLSPLHEKGEEADHFLLHLSLALRGLRSSPPQATRALIDLASGMETNVSRQLLTQQFVLSLRG